jgi:hypothetical protein
MNITWADVDRRVILYNRYGMVAAFVVMSLGALMFLGYAFKVWIWDNWRTRKI